MRRFFLAFLLLTGCSQQYLGEFSGLIGTGVLPLSSDNGYNGANLMLSKELESSTYLYNFFVGHEAPQAIEVLDSDSSVQIRLLYPQNREVFIAEPASRNAQKKAGREWVVRGPVSLSRDQLRTLLNLRNNADNQPQSQPVFIISGREHRFSKEPIKPEVVVEKVFVPVIIPTVAPVPSKKRAKVITNKGSSSEAAVSKSIENLDQKALSEATSGAKLP